MYYSTSSAFQPINNCDQSKATELKNKAVCYDREEEFYIMWHNALPP